MGVTIYDIARLTGYNPGTVSRALNNDPRIRDNTRKKIREAGEKLGYVPNHAAKSLITGRTQSIAVVSRSFFAGPMTELVASFNSLLMKKGYLLMSLVYSSEEQFRMCLSRLKCGFCDGAVLLSPPQMFSNVPELNMLEKSNFPVLCFDQWLPDKDFPVISNDAEESIRLLTEKLMEKGINGAFVGFSAKNTVGAWRKECTEKFLRKAGIPYTGDKTILAAFCRQHKITDLALYMNTSSELDEFSYFLPQDHSVRCFSGIFDPWNRLVPDFISGGALCIQDFERESERAVEILFDMMNGKEFPSEKKEFFPPKMILSL